MKIKNILKELVLATFVVFAFSCGSDDSGSGDATGTGGGSGSGSGSGSGNGNGGGSTALSLTMSQDQVWLGEGVNFTVKDQTFQNVTATSTFYVDGTEITGTTYNPTTAGDFEIYAKLGDVQSNTVMLTVAESTHTTKVMVEDYTGTWCQFCPRLAYALDQAVAANANIIPVAVHSEINNYPSGLPLNFPGVNTLLSTFGITGFPSGKVNRTMTWNESTSQPLSLLSAKQKMGLAINSSLSGNTITAEVKVHYDLGEEGEQKLVVYLLENGLVYPQVNFYNTDSSSPFYQQGNPIVDFVHNHTARTTFTNMLGDVIPSSDTETGDTYIANFSVTVPSNVENNANLELVAFVTGSNNTVLNVQKADLGENKDFD